MTYIKASEEVIDAATAFVKAHEDVYRRWARRTREEVPCGEFMQLCEAMGFLEYQGKWYCSQYHPAVSGSAQVSAVDHPAHYNSGGIEVIDAIEAWGLGFSDGNAVKYIARAGKKDPRKTIEDLKKARWYLNRLIDGVS